MSFRRFGRPDNRFGASRHGHKKLEFDGLKWDSREELDRYVFLRALERDGEIRDLRVKIPWTVTVNGVKIWRARVRFEFVYVEGPGTGTIVPTSSGGWAVSEGGGMLRVEEWKGYVDRKSDTWQVFVAKARLVYALHGVKVRVLQKNGRDVPIRFEGVRVSLGEREAVSV